MRNRVVSFAIMLAFGLGALACSPVPSPQTGGGTGRPEPPFEGEVPQDALRTTSEVGRYGGTMVMAHEANPRTFNPVIATETSSTDITRNILNAALVHFNNAEQKEEPELVREHTVSPDGLVYDLMLRRGVRFSDGSEFNADDVVFTYNVVVDDKIGNSFKDLFRQSDGSYPVLEKIAPDHVRFTLKEPNAEFFTNLTDFHPLPSDRLEQAWKEGKFDTVYGLDSKPEDIVGLGPFRLKEYAADQRIVFERNPYYWKVDSAGNRLPYIDRIVLTIVPNFNSALLAFAKGDTDMMKNVRVMDVETLKREAQAKDFTVYDLGTSFNTNYLTFNNNTGRNKSGGPLIDPKKLEWFRNTKFRQAVSYAMDRQGLTTTVFLGLGTPIYSLTTPANKTWYSDEYHVKYPYDLERAKALLAEIGIQDRNGDGFVEDSSGRVVEFTLTTNVENEARVNIGNFVKDNLSKLGFRVHFQPIPFNELITKMRDSFEWDALILGWQTGVPPSPGQMKNVILSSGESHTWFPEQKTPSTEAERKMDELLHQNLRSVDLAERQRAYNELIRIWTTEQFEISLVASNFFCAAKNKFGNLRPSPLPPYTYWNLYELYFTK